MLVQEVVGCMRISRSFIDDPVVLDTVHGQSRMREFDRRCDDCHAGITIHKERRTDSSPRQCVSQWLILLE